MLVKTILNKCYKFKSFVYGEAKLLTEDDGLVLHVQIHLFWSYVSSSWASHFLDQWTTKVMRSRIEPLKREAKTIRRHKPLILNWFKAKKQFSSGIVEGLNNKVKLTMRKSYGFREYKSIRIALFHTLGRLPEPPLTHRFW